MTAMPRTPYDTSRTGLAELDPALPGLAELLTDARAHGWQLHDAQWRPGARCRLAFRAPGPQRPPRHATFVAVDVTPSGTTRRDYRSDPDLAGLREATDGRAVPARLRMLLGEDVALRLIEPVRYRAGSRCVVRYVVATGGGRRELYAKVYGGDRPRFATVAATAPALASAVPDLAAPWVATWADLEALVHHQAPGRRVSAILGDHAVPAAERVRLGLRLGASLARLHTARVDAPVRNADHFLSEACAALPAARQVDAAVGGGLEHAVERLAQDMPAAEARVLCHGGFRAGQAVADGSGLALLDLDGLCWSPPGRDLGTAVAHLAWQRLRQPADAAVLTATRQAFLRGYEAGGRRVDEASLRWWTAAAMVHLAARRFRRLEVDDWPLVPALLRELAGLLGASHPRPHPSVTAPATAPVGAHGATAALTVADLCDTERMTAELRPLLARGQPHGAGARVVSARLLAYAPGRRAVMSYQVRDGEPARTTELIAKAFTESWRAAVLHANLQQMTRAIAGVGDAPVPAVVGLLPERGLVVYHAADGMPLDRLGTGRVEGARAAARWLATVHGSAARLSRRLDMAVEPASCRQWAARIAAQLRSLRAPARDLAARWSEVAATTRVRTDVPMHKDFHPGHVLVRADGGVTVLDVDEARMGDPALDVAHFCAYLQLGGAPAAVERAFLDQYDVLAGAQTGSFGREWDRAFALFSAYSWLKIAKQLASGSGPCPVGEDARADAVAHALRRGSACLGK